ncbi:MAG: YciI family protein [Actinomycetia bacterium]|nr:YciI family protein [Actinomycetes bacterium]
MRVMVMIKGAGANEEKITPTQEMFEQMGAYNEELVKAGIMLDGNGLLPSGKGAKVVFEGGTTSVVDGPFAESKEVIAGYWIWQVKSLEEAVEWVKKCPNDPSLGDSVLEVRQIAEMEDFGDAYTDDVREHEEKLTEQIKQQHG